MKKPTRTVRDHLCTSKFAKSTDVLLLPKYDALSKAVHFLHPFIPELDKVIKGTLRTQSKVSPCCFRHLPVHEH